jgi:hypothetical protein
MPGGDEATILVSPQLATKYVATHLLDAIGTWIFGSLARPVWFIVAS